MVIASDQIMIMSDPIDNISDPIDITSDPIDNISDPIDITSDPIDNISDPIDITSDPIDNISDPIDMQVSEKADASDPVSALGDKTFDVVSDVPGIDDGVVHGYSSGWIGCAGSERLWRRDGELTADLAREMIGDLLMSWNRLDVTGEGIAPELVFFTLALQKTAISAQMAEELFLFHSTTTVSRVAPAGTPRRASSRRSSRMSAIASPRFVRASSRVRP